MSAGRVQEIRTGFSGGREMIDRLLIIYHDGDPRDGDEPRTLNSKWFRPFQPEERLRAAHEKLPPLPVRMAPRVTGSGIPSVSRRREFGSLTLDQGLSAGIFIRTETLSAP